MASKMSLVEEECRMTIAIAYAEWHWKRAKKMDLNLIEYERAIGLEFPF